MTRQRNCDVTVQCPLQKLFQQGLKPGKKPQAAFHLRFIVRAAEGERQREFEGHYPPEASP